MLKEWPLGALQAVLMSGVAHLFVRAYSTKMHGGALRFQAQYLRRIRLPRWMEISAADQQALIAGSATTDRESILDVVTRIYRLTADERKQFPSRTP